MSAQSRTGNQNNKKLGGTARVIASRGLVLPALAALGIGGPASALELGPAKVQSTLGQPLRASIAFALRPFEEIAPYCIRVTPGRSASGLPSAGRASVTLRDGAIHVAGEASVSEPLLALQLTVDCPYAPHLSREYVVFVDPERPSEVTQPAMPAATAAPAERAPATAGALKRAEKPPIAASTSYRVQRGDTLSDIAQRLSGRRVDLWQTADLLFAANPGAFVDQDPDLLRAGALLRIPDTVYAAQSPAAAQPAVAERAAQGSPAEASTAYPGYVPKAAAEPRKTASVPGGLFLDGTSEARNAGTESAATPPVTPATHSAQPEAPAPAAQAPRAGDVLVEAGGLFVSPIEIEGESAAPADAAPLVGPAGDNAVPRAPGSAGEAANGGWSWLAWLAGTGVALILGLLLFGRTLKGRTGRLAYAPGSDFTRRDAAAAPDDEPQVGGEIKVDFRLDEADADARLVRVDVDLDDGTGFPEAGDLDVAEDFGFSASGGLELGLDVDFSDEPPAMLRATGRRRESGVIVEEEVPPGESATSEYDVSMIVDATRQPLDATDDTEKDLHAVELESAEADPEEEPFTLSREVDYKIIEQDYEDELTATQALAAELSNAARDLVERMCDETHETALHELPTVELPAPGTEPTAELPRAVRKDDPASETVEMRSAAAATEGSDTDASEDLALLPDAGNDESADLELESAAIDTKKLRVS